MIHDARIERFIAAFTDHSGGCRRLCECGKTYYNSDGGWDWEDGELEELETSPEAICLDFTVCTLSFGGKEYVEECDCWHKSARKIMEWLDDHAPEVAAYLNGEKAAAIVAANGMPEVPGQNV